MISIREGLYRVFMVVLQGGLEPLGDFIQSWKRRKSRDAAIGGVCVSNGMDE